MADMIITNSIAKLLLEIYDDFFKKSNQTSLDVFLCGKGTGLGKKSTRDSLREKLENEKDIRILYPEDLLVDFLNKNKQYNMLSLEKFLADNCDVICIICEDSPGALVELGAFTVSHDTSDKVLAMVQAKYKKKKSFIMLGPIKYIQQKNKENVLYYSSSNLDAAHKDLSKRLRSILRHRDKAFYRDLDTILGQYYFIIFLLYFFKRLTVKNIIEFINVVIRKRNIKIENDNMNVVFSAALKQLYKERLVEKINSNDVDLYTLTSKGVALFFHLFYSLKIEKKTKRCDKIRLTVLSNSYYEHCPS